MDENVVYSEEENLKAEQFKDKGNEYFKGKNYLVLRYKFRFCL